MTEPDWDALQGLKLADWQPRQQVQLTETEVPLPAAPVIDVHNHLGRWLWGGESTIHDRWTGAEGKDWVVPDVAALVKMMDANRVSTIVNLDGMWGEEVTANLDRYDRAYPGRFVTFCQLDWALLEEADGEVHLMAQLEDNAARGARGIKVWKNLGLSFRGEDGQVILPDDPRVVALLRRAGELGLPVLIHVADPKAFFDDLDARNERVDELLHHRDWWFGDRDHYPSFERILESLANLVRSTPGTSYIGAHVGCAAEDLDWVEGLMAEAPNFSVDIASRIGELGRQPRRFRRLVDRFPDRIMFGTDNYPPTADDYAVHYRFFESEDESFPYAPGTPIPPQGRWTVSGLGLPADLLARIYSGNAARMLGLPTPVAE